jgi:hypothetical protein
MEHLQGKFMFGLIVIALAILACAAITYIAAYKISPESFKVNASIMKFASFSVEITSAPRAEGEPKRVQ